MATKMLRASRLVIQNSIALPPSDISKKRRKKKEKNGIRGIINPT
jgi:hypothetical protein